MRVSRASLSTTVKVTAPSADCTTGAAKTYAEKTIKEIYLALDFLREGVFIGGLRPGMNMLPGPQTHIFAGKSACSARPPWA